jgi:hypothetical protein
LARDSPCGKQPTLLVSLSLQRRRRRPLCLCVSEIAVIDATFANARGSVLLSDAISHHGALYAHRSGTCTSISLLFRESLLSDSVNARLRGLV